MGATCHACPSRSTWQAGQACVAGDEQPATPYSVLEPALERPRQEQSGKKVPFQTKGPQR